MAPGGSERPTQPDLGAPFEDRNHHDAGDPNAADEQRDRAEPEEQRGERALGASLGLERVGGPADLDLFGMLWVRGRRDEVPDGTEPRVVGADVRARRVRIGAERGLGEDPATSARRSSSGCGRPKMVRGQLPKLLHGPSLDAGRVPDEFIDWRLALNRETDPMRTERDMVRAIASFSGLRAGAAIRGRGARGHRAANAPRSPAVGSRVPSRMPGLRPADGDLPALPREEPRHRVDGTDQVTGVHPDRVGVVGQPVAEQVLLEPAAEVLADPTGQGVDRLPAGAGWPGPRSGGSARARR